MAAADVDPLPRDPAGSLGGEKHDRAGELDPPGPATINSIVGFGEDANGEMYICDLGGEVFKIVPVGAPGNCTQEPGDTNHDGAVNNFDIDGFVACLTSGCP